MKKRFTEEQIIGVLKEAEAGAKVAELCRKHGISEAIQEHLQGIIPRPSSILIDFRWDGIRFRERVKLRPTEANIRAARRMRAEIVQLINLERFTWDDFARYFPDSPRRPQRDVPPDDPTFSDMADRWLALARPTVAATTWDEYKNLLNNYWRPLFGPRIMRSITYEELVLGIAQLPSLAAKTFNNAMTPLRGTWAMAAKMRKVDANLTLEIESRKGQRPLPDPLEVSEVMLVLEYLRRHGHPNWWNYFTVAFFGGPRPSEEIALKWSRIDFRREQMRIDSARVRRIDKGTKTLVVREVDLQSPALEALERQKTVEGRRPDFVFFNPENGERLTDTAAPLAVWRSTLEALGIRERDARQTRHTYATMGLHAGMNPGYLSRQMGHKNAKMFFEVYSKWIDGAANQLEKDKMRNLVARHAPKDSP